MGLRQVLALLVLAAVIAASASEAHSEPSAPVAVLELMPPATRSLEARADLEEVRTPHGAHVIEHVTFPEGSASGAVEVEYTVDPELDDQIRDVLRASRITLGHVILMDPATGEILSYVSTDPARFPATRAYPTASLMKVVTAAALLRNAPKAAHRDCRYLGSPWELHTDQLQAPAHGGSVHSFARALAQSNNQCFARFAVHDIGAPALLAEIRGAGLLEEAAPGHAAGRVELERGDLALGHLGSGMSGAFVTPLGALRLAAALASGELVEPYWIARVRDASGNLLALPQRQSALPIWPAEITQQLRELTIGVTESGTAAGAFHDTRGTPVLGPIRVAGKTGTVSGRNPDGRYQWFIGVAPAEAPRIAIAAIVVDEPAARSSASRVAAASLRTVFCTGGPCDATRLEALHARARAREIRTEPELMATKPEREQPLPIASDPPAGAQGLTELDANPRPIGDTSLDLPRRLRKKKVSGEVVLLLELSAEGRVLGAKIDSSDLPDFNEFVSTEVSAWRFTPPTRGGRPVEARARLPIAIHIQ